MNIEREIQNDTVIYLQKLGLTMYQAKILSALFEGEQTALDLSDKSGVPYTKMYVVLDSLRYMGFVIADMKRPMTFKAIPIGLIVDSLVKRQAEALNRTKQIGEELKEMVA